MKAQVRRWHQAHFLSFASLGGWWREDRRQPAQKATGFRSTTTG